LELPFAWDGEVTVPSPLHVLGGELIANSALDTLAKVNGQGRPVLRQVVALGEYALPFGSVEVGYQQAGLVCLLSISKQRIIKMMLCLIGANAEVDIRVESIGRTGDGDDKFAGFLSIRGLRASND
jgi:hypothetical protein